MNLVDLFTQTPIERHKNIKVRGDQVYIIDNDGVANLEYLFDIDGQLLPVYSDKKLGASIDAIKKKLGI